MGKTRSRHEGLIKRIVQKSSQLIVGTCLELEKGQQQSRRVVLSSHVALVTWRPACDYNIAVRCSNFTIISNILHHHLTNREAGRKTEFTPVSATFLLTHAS